jgi:hypothetical protein
MTLLKNMEDINYKHNCIKYLIRDTGCREEDRGLVNNKF